MTHLSSKVETQNSLTIISDDNFVGQVPPGMIPWEEFQRKMKNTRLSLKYLKS